VAPDVRLEPDEIIVTARTDRSFLPALRQAAGLVSSEGDLTEHCGIVAVEMGLPAVVGAAGALQSLSDGLKVVLDAGRGVVLERHA